ncbi:MAG TPA: hypothetical protein VNB49_18145, partial [Candidatus Dormibacteraeota bacterium]|nr:hypothetical protein [Candidatus Dormibacteraeota bacterium]
MEEFKNNSQNHLGMPLPKGRVRFYRRDDDGQLEFTGENDIDHTPKDETIRLYTGNAFDLTGERTRTEYRADFNARWIDESFEIKVRNHKTFLLLSGNLATQFGEKPDCRRPAHNLLCWGRIPRKCPQSGVLLPPARCVRPHQESATSTTQGEKDMRSVWRNFNIGSCICCLAALMLFKPVNVHGQSWPQWALNPQHTLFDGGIVGQPLNQINASFVYDFNVAAEKADPNTGNGLDIHYQVPLAEGNDVYVESKDGTYSNNTYSTQKWHQNKYTWQGSKLMKVWTFNTDWFAPGSSKDFWEPVYHAVLANGFLYDPGQG